LKYEIVQTHLPHVFIGEDKRGGFGFILQTLWREACRKIDITAGLYRKISENAAVTTARK
jgi:hypothetical protein